MPVKIHLRLGEILLRERIINEIQLRDAIHLQKTTGKRLGEALIDLNAVTDQQLAEVLGRQLGIPYRRFDKGELHPVDDAALKILLPDEMIRKNLVLPLERKKNTLTVALVDPLDLILVDNLKKMTGCKIQPAITTRDEILSAIEAAYGKVDLLKAAVKGTYGKEDPNQISLLETVEDIGAETDTLSTEDLAAKAGEAQVIRLVDLFLMEAVHSRASDIHIEPYAHRISIRFRIDGVLQAVDPPSPHLVLPIISRIKILSRMDIAEKRLPQDGGFSIRMGHRVVDLRVATIPVVYGEKVVIRLLDKSALVYDFAELGLEGAALEALERAIRAPYGLVFMTGPTGSGKSTTLYAILNRLKDTSKNLLSIEDPIEYKIEGVNQVQAKPQIGLSFATGLRAFLRQDPDIIMVGEVRDLETAEICVRAALTGHLVLSTLHTNDAPSAITRLVDIGIEPFLLSPSLLLLAAQRLVRKLCPDCKERTDPISPRKTQITFPPGTYFKAKGCSACRNIGFQGRVGLYEVLTATDSIRELIGRRAPQMEILKMAKQEGMSTLLEAGLLKAAAGITSLEEVFGVTIGIGEL